MRRITGRTLALVFILLGFAAGVGILAFSFALNGARWATNRANGHIYTGGAIARAGSVLDRNGVILAETKNKKRDMPGGATLRRATLHAVGDPQGFVSTGAHAAFRGDLTGYSAISGIYNVVRYGRGSDVRLTIDANLCKTAWQALNGRKGTVAVYNYKTGEVLCMVSSPSYDPLNKPKDIDTNKAYDAVYLNRFLHGLFTPGSTFKIITAACAMEHMPDIDNRTFTCTGKYATGEGYVTCREKHGSLGFEKAMNVSCNSVFAQLAVELGEARLKKTAEAMGFNQTYQADKLPLAISRFPPSPGETARPRNPLELGWTGVGQHTTLANPAQMLLLMGAIANGGQGIAPKLVLNTITPNGTTMPASRARVALRIDPTIASRLRVILRSDVTRTYDPSGKKTGDLQLCGKTGTAEVDGKQPHAWFVGFALNPAKPYAIVVVGENAGGGQAVAFEIAAAVMREIK
ncbi:MAG: penicillin-binding transpeptidase domain-containing protein [Oscillospiraceae bacterium]|nr:penicillin-binding transpeptidase domain-containing protein [Oscillospiraceae bacterium]